MRSIIILLGLIAVASAIPSLDVLQKEWSAFKVKYNKKYEGMEDSRRFKIFNEAKQKIAKHNAKYLAGEVTYEMGLNEFADMSHEEFLEKMTMASHMEDLSAQIDNSGGQPYVSPENPSVPSSVDWRNSGAVTPVRNQGGCGSCWAFSAAGSLEGRHFLKYRKLVSLSPQNLVDCSRAYGTNGCKGGWMNDAFRYIQANGGIDTEQAYPYRGVEQSCRFDRNGIGARDYGYVDIPYGNEGKLQEAVANAGPIAFAYDACRPSFQYYKSGVYNEPSCIPNNTCHASVIVGYGNEGGKDYWLVKNSWGSSWGDRGYIKMSRNKNNQCGIATKASYPVV